VADRCESAELTAIGIRGGASVKGESPLGERMRESFTGGDLFGIFRLPLNWYSASGWGAGTRLMSSVGLLSEQEKVALVTSLVPMVSLGREDDRFSVNVGIGGALISAHRFGRHDLGGPFQFVGTAGVSIELARPWNLGYRFQHYSDGTVYGNGTRGVDLHMIELIYRY
jgi:hypothetical protein